ncbi:alpha/beta hydrolase-fold protein [Erythrobacter sp. Alg231-14]|uniref:alpha/beta hydrolase-fold protein n=1 Tax=Erythrobacter sp. Alg231-14 TaxID=1922225 RepID=UPI000D560F0C
MISAFAATLLVLQPVGDFAPLTIGETATFHILDEDRAVNVILPPDYNDHPDHVWPVVYMLDGALDQDLMMGAGIAGWNRLWGRSQSVIWVGVETKDRQRELLPPTRNDAEAGRYPTAGDSAIFRNWLVNAVMPRIAERYRTDGAYLVGESAAGHFVVETWIETPAAFAGYAAISPSLQWDEESLSNRFDAGDPVRPALYISLADEGGATESGVMRAIGAMPTDQPWCFSDRRSDLKHATSLHGLLPEALQFLLPTRADWLEEFGFELRCDQSGPKAG